jgi:hypothetical protein
MVPWPWSLRHPEEGSCDATLPGWWELLVRRPNVRKRGVVATFPYPVHPPPRLGGGAAYLGNLAPYSARLGIVPSHLARLDDVGLSHVTNGAGTISKATAQAAQRRAHTMYLRNDDRPSPALGGNALPKTTGQAGRFIFVE